MKNELTLDGNDSYGVLYFPSLVKKQLVLVWEVSTRPFSMTLKQSQK